MSATRAEAPLELAPMQVPADYYRHLFEVEQAHPWHRGMREIAAALLGDRLRAPGARLLDAGCGTGGFLHWAVAAGAPARVCGVDISPEAVELCASRVPEAELHVAPLRELPFEDAAFDLAVTNDVLQHVPEREIADSMDELRRVLRPGGTLLVRTNGGRRASRERPDWRLYDSRLLVGIISAGGFRCERVTYVNAAGSLLAALRGRGPKAPGAGRHGIPDLPGPAAAWISSALLGAEAAYLRRARRRSPSIPYGHTLVAVATRIP
jgi:SAM-dependent methyltransferase